VALIRLWVELAVESATNISALSSILSPHSYITTTAATVTFVFYEHFQLFVSGLQIPLVEITSL
jgi:hypothetical protein